MGRQAGGQQGLCGPGPIGVVFRPRAAALVKALIDTDILVDFLFGREQASRELNTYEQAYISLVTWTEVMAGAQSADEELKLRGFLAGFTLEEIGKDTAEAALRLRRDHGLSAPNSLILASARARNLLLVTRNAQGYPSDDPGIRVPY